MREEVISKKEVLRLTGISYGQLYRWKRKGLVPEAWFVHRATVTGQETFFPKDKILARISQIQAMKEAKSLDEMAHLLSPEATDPGSTWESNGTLNAVGKEAKGLLWKESGYTYSELVALAAGAEALKAGLEHSQAQLLVVVVRSEEELLRNPAGAAAVLAEKTLDREGVSVRVPYAVVAREPVRVDGESRVRHRADLERLVERVKLKLGEVQ
ncbi:MAG: DUF4004 family protein [Candidatus Bipolaricaulota bacterium]